MAKIDRDTFGPELMMPPETSMLAPDVDRRIRGTRVEVVIPVYLRFKDKPIQGYAEARDLSFGGMLLETAMPVDVGDSFGIEFSLPEIDVPVSTQVMVVHKSPNAMPGGEPQFGVIFGELDPNIRRAIVGFVLEYIDAY